MKLKRIIITVLIVLVIALLLIALLSFLPRSSDIAVSDDIERIGVTSSAFEDFGAMPIVYTGRGEDISPPFQLEGVANEAKSIAIIMEDLDVPLVGNYTHWTIWNLPPESVIPEAISHGEIVSELGDAVQGMGFGKHQYRGPKPPFGTHRYQFHFFVLDAMLELDASAGKKELVQAMNGHILQYGTIMGWYPTAK